MASGTDYHFTIPCAAPILDLDGGSYPDSVFKSSGDSTSQKRKPAKKNNQLCSVPVPVRAVKPATPSVSSFVPQSVLVGSLLEHLCSLYEPDPAKAKRLFQSMCVQLEKLNVVSSVTYQEEFASIRSQYKASFYNIIHSVQLNLNGITPLPSLPFATSQTNIENAIKRRSSSEKVFKLVPSRYEEEFEELCELGKGAFGKVYKARNKIDRQDYAVKKIFFKDIDLDGDPQQVKKIMREVESLAALQHPNVVRYHHSWMEHNFEDKMHEDEDSASTLSLSQKKKSIDQNYASNHSASLGNVSPGTSNTDISWEDFSQENEPKNGMNSKFWIGQDDSSGSESEMSKASELPSKQLKVSSHAHSPPNEIILTHGVRRDTEMKRVQSVIFGKNIQKNEISNKFSFLNSSTTRSRSANCLEDIKLNNIDATAFFPQTSVQSHPSSITLFIQMQICDSSLQDWLIKRNKSCKLSSDIMQIVDEQKTFDIYSQLLTALAYIHEKEIMHRDLKPRNIFLNGSRPHVMLGDFGLSRPALSRNSSVELNSLNDQILTFDDLDEHTSGVGTTSYAAPEQLAHEHYDFKADMYSAGIILFELTWPMQTGHERGDYIRKLREENVPSEYILLWKDTAKILQSLVSCDPDKRPLAMELLNKGCFSSCMNQNLAKLCAENKTFKEEIKRLHEENSHLQSENSHLRSENSRLQSENSHLQSENSHLQSLNYKYLS